MLTDCWISLAVYLIIFSFIQYLSDLRVFLQDGTCLRIIDAPVFFDEQHRHLGHQNFLNVQGDTTRSNEAVGTCDASDVRTEMVYDMSYAWSNRQNGVSIKSIKGRTHRISEPLGP